MLAAAALLVSSVSGGLLCGQVSSFELNSGDTAKVHQSGLHAGTALIRTKGRRFRYGESDVMRDGTPVGDWIGDLRPERVRKIRLFDGTTGYAFYGQFPKEVLPVVLTEDPLPVRPIVFLEGPGLKFDASDIPILKRVRLAVPDKERCTVTLYYGFDAALGGATKN